MAKYEIRRYDTSGNLLEVIGEFKKLSYVRTVNTIGSMELYLPLGKYRYGDFSNNQLLEIWREKAGTNKLQNETAYFLKDWELISSGGEGLVRLLAFDANWLLTTRIVAYAAGSAQAEMTDEADAMMRAIVIDNFGADANSTRRLAEFTVSPIKEDSQEVTKAFSRRNVFQVLQEIAEAATEAGTNTYFDVVRTQINKFVFRTYTGQRGIDHGGTSSDIRLVGEDYGNFEDVRFGTYHSQEVNYVYAGGQGQKNDRMIVEVSATKRINNGYPYNRIEAFADARQADTTAAVRAEGRAKLREGKPKRVISGRLIDTPAMQYDIHYGFGDIVSVKAFNFVTDCHAKSVRGVVDDSGELLDIRLEGEL